MDHSEAPLRGPETYRLADMHGVLMDLRRVFSLCELICAKMALRPPMGRPEDGLELEALQAAAMVRYGRCFRGGVRTAFVLDAAWINSLPAELRRAHSYFVALRDKYVAHSVNDWESNLAVAQLRRTKGRPTEVVSVRVESGWVSAIDARRIQELGRVSSALAKVVDEEFEIERGRVLKVVSAMPIAELEARLSKPEPRSALGDGALDKPRGRPR